MHSMASVEAARAALFQKCSDLEDTLAEFPVPIYGLKSNRVPVLVGTAFLLRIESVIFIVTAAHVIAEGREAGLWVMGNAGFQQLAMQMYCARPDLQHGIDFDVAFNVLPAALRDSLLSRYSAVDIAVCEPNHVVNSKTIYCFLGHPSSLNKQKLNTNTLTATILPYRIVTLQWAEFEALGLNLSMHLAMRFDSPNTKHPDGVVRTPPNPKGASGCAVWSLGSLAEIDQGTASPKVVGVGIAHRTHPDRLEATRIAAVLETIRAIQPDLSLHIPKGQFLGVGVTVH